MPRLMNPGRRTSRLVLLFSILSPAIAGLGCGAAAPSPETPTAEAASPAAPVLNPDPQGAVATGTYRNLFVDLGYPASAVDAKLKDAYERVFHGSADEAVFFDAGEN